MVEQTEDKENSFFYAKVNIFFVIILHVMYVESFIDLSNVRNIFFS